MTQKINTKTGISQNWVKADNLAVHRAEAESNLRKAKQNEIGKKYIRIPHPTVKNTFILRER